MRLPRWQTDAAVRRSPPSTAQRRGYVGANDAEGAGARAETCAGPRPAAALSLKRSGFEGTAVGWDPISPRLTRIPPSAFSVPPNRRSASPSGGGDSSRRRRQRARVAAAAVARRCGGVRGLRTPEPAVETDRVAGLIGFGAARGGRSLSPRSGDQPRRQVDWSRYMKWRSWRANAAPAPRRPSTGPADSDGRRGERRRLTRRLVSAPARPNGPRRPPPVLVTGGLCCCRPASVTWPSGLPPRKALRVRHALSEAARPQLQPTGRDDCTVRVMVRCVPAARQATSLGRGALTGEAVVPRASRGDRIRGGSGAGGIGGRGGEGLRRC